MKRDHSLSWMDLQKDCRQRARREKENPILLGIMCAVLLVELLYFVG